MPGAGLRRRAAAGCSRAGTHCNAACRAQERCEITPPGASAMMRMSFSTKVTAAIAAGVAILVVLGLIVALRLTYIGTGLGIALLIWLIFAVNRYESDRRRSESTLLEHDQRLKLALELAQ